MDLNEYQNKALSTAKYKPEDGVNYTALGLAEEAGEYCGRVAKHILRGGDFKVYEAAKELGDVLWYVAAASKELGFSLNTIALINVAKLRNREDNGTIIDLENGDRRD